MNTTTAFAIVILLSAGLAGQAPTSATPAGQQLGPSTSDQTTDSSDPFHPKTTVTVTATRSETELDKSPVSASVVTLKEMEARPVRTVDQNLTLLEGISVQRTQGPSATDAQTLLRGFNGSARTLVLVDGQPINDSYASSVNWTGLPTEELQSIEVARGPFSTLYGGNALGGVINIRTRPIQRRQLDLMGEYGTYDTTRYSVRFNDRFFEKLGISIGYQRLQVGGYNSRTSTVTPSAGTTGALVTGAIPTFANTGTRATIVGQGGLNWLNQHAIRIRGEYTFGKSTVISLQYMQPDYRFGYTGYRSYLRDPNGNVVDSGTFLFNSNGTLQRLTVTPRTFLQGPGEQHSHFVSLSLNHQFSPRAGFRADAGYYNIPGYQFITPGTVVTEFSGPGTLSDGVRRNYHGNLQYNRFLRRHQLIFGGETRHDMAANNTLNLANWTIKNSTQNQTYFAFGRSVNQSAYVQDQISLAERLSLTLGGRYDYWKGYDGQSNTYTAASPLTYYPDRTNNKLTGKAALVYSLPGDWNVRVSAGTAFRNPNVFDLYATSVTGSGVKTLSNPSLLPETVKSWETGVRKRFGQKADFDVAYYENYIKNLVYRATDLVADPNGMIRVNINAGGARTRGVESAFRQELLPGLQFRATYTFTNALITSNPANPNLVGKRVTFIPEHTAAAQLLGIRGKWTGSVSGRYSGAFFQNDTNSDTTRGVPGGYDPFFLMDANLGYNINSRLQLYVTSENLLDRRYYQFYLSPGRTIYAGFRFRL